jgi:hypothetical protein
LIAPYRFPEIQSSEAATQAHPVTVRLILELMTLMAIEMTLGIQSELDRRIAGSD